MFKRQRKSFVALLAALTFFVYDTRQASAIVDPITISIASAALLGTVVAGGGAYYYAKYYSRENGGTRDSSGTMVSAAGHIARDATITYVALAAGVLQNVTRNITARAKFDVLQTGVNSNPAKYPKLSTALQHTNYIDSEHTNFSNPSSMVGTTVCVSPSNYHVPTAGLSFLVGAFKTSGSNTLSYTSPGAPTTYNVIWDSTRKELTFSSFVYQYTQTTFPYSLVYKNNYMVFTASQVATLPSVIPATPSQFASTLANASTAPTAPANVYSDFYGEIDDFIKDNPNVMEYVDTDNSGQADNAPPFVLPPAPTAAQIDSAQSTATAAEAAKAALDAAQKSAATARTAATNARSRADSTGLPADIAAAEVAEATADAADAYVAKLIADQAHITAVDAVSTAEKETDTPASLSASPTRKQLDFSSFNNLKGALSTTFPFTLLAAIPGYFEPFVRDPVAPVFHLPLYGNDLVVDLAIFDPVAAIFRWICGIIVTIGALFYSVHFWRGVS